MAHKIDFVLTLHDDEETFKKLKLLSKLEVMFDHTKNALPFEFFDIENLHMGESVRITIEFPYKNHNG